MKKSEEKSNIFLLIYAIAATAVVLMVLAGCQPQKYMQTAEKKASQIANPASTFCNEHGGNLIIKETKDGQEGICNFPDGTWCDEWDYYKGSCLKGENMTSCTGQFWGKSVCPAEYNPVCGTGEDGQMTYRNACVACTSGAEGYIHGEC